uniref:Uncharacterized protein n=1 Tax=Arundo donax TaxID=35708 RepID=A0A0A8ZXU0_ARUDO
MAQLLAKQAAVYATARPAYPKDLFLKLAALTTHHRFAWDVGTGNGQAAIGVSRGALRRRGGHGRERGAAAARRGAPQGPVPPHPRRRPRGEPRRRARRRGRRRPHHGGAGRPLVRPPGVLRRRPPRPAEARGVIAVWGYNYRIRPVEDMRPWEGRRACEPRHGAQDVIRGAHRHAEVVVGGDDGEAARRGPAGEARGEGAGGRVGRGVAGEQGDLQGLLAGRHAQGR